VATTSNSGTRIPGFPFGKVVTVSDGWGNTTESTGKPILLMMEAQSFAQDMMVVQHAVFFFLRLLTFDLLCRTILAEYL